nr:pentatricopeptide repeat protein AaPPR75 [Agave angustifolia]
MVDHAVRAFDSIPAAGLKHTERTLCALLTVFLKNRLFDRLIDSFHGVPESIKIKPGVTAHNILLQGLCEKGDVTAARKLLDEMPQKGVKPDIVSYNAVFNGYLKKWDKVGCEEILKEMNGKGLEANVVTFNCRIAGLCATGRSFEAEELLDVMATKKVKPNRNTFNMVIEGFCKEGNAKKAMRIFKRMKSVKEEDEGSASPNFDTYVMLIKSLVENREFGKGLEVFKECTDRKWSPPFAAVRGLVEGLKKESRVDEAKEVVAKMKKVVKGDAMDAWKNIEAAISF